MRPYWQEIAEERLKKAQDRLEYKKYLPDGWSPEVEVYSSLIQVEQNKEIISLLKQINENMELTNSSQSEKDTTEE